ncbi:MAG: hypothetical protein O3A14_10510, partial [Cyanobacteria bacterium]|nr:hypothetical protein [Cyanobacteriota bacterium]
FAAGDDAFLKKPIDLSELIQVLQAQLQLDWVYAQKGEALKQTATDHASHPLGGAPMVPPPQEKLEKLIFFAKMGDIEALENQLQALAQDPLYGDSSAPFIDSVKEFTGAFQVRDLRAFLESLLRANCVSYQ